MKHSFTMFYWVISWYFMRTQTVWQAIFIIMGHRPKRKWLSRVIDSSLFASVLLNKFSCMESTKLNFISLERIESLDVYKLTVLCFFQHFLRRIGGNLQKRFCVFGGGGVGLAGNIYHFWKDDFSYDWK